MIKLAIISSFLIAFGIGSNDASNALGISIGAGIIRFKKAVFLFGILVFTGVLLNGDKVMKTVGKNLIEASPFIISLALIISSFLILLSNWKKLPLSTHQVIIGSLIGSGFALNHSVNLVSLAKIFISWIISPFIACMFGFFLYILAEKWISKIPFFEIEKLLRSLLLLSASLISYNTGANELATVLGPIVYIKIPINIILLYFLASFFIFLGAITMSYRVIETVGKGIIPLDPFSGFIAQFSAGICIFLFTLFGMPVSTTYCIIGALSGVGITKGLRTIKLNLIKRIAINWLLTLLSAFTISFLLTKLILIF